MAYVLSTMCTQITRSYKEKKASSHVLEKYTQSIRSIRLEQLKWILMTYFLHKLYDKTIMACKKRDYYQGQIFRRYFEEFKNWTKSYFAIQLQMREKVFMTKRTPEINAEK